MNDKQKEIIINKVIASKIWSLFIYNCILLLCMAIIVLLNEYFFRIEIVKTMLSLIVILVVGFYFGLMVILDILNIDMREIRDVVKND